MWAGMIKMDALGPSLTRLSLYIRELTDLIQRASAKFGIMPCSKLTCDARPRKSASMTSSLMKGMK